MSKAAVRQKRGGTISRSSSLIEDTSKNVKRRQKIYLEEHVCTIFRVTLKPNEEFSQKQALALVDKYRGKRQAHCTGRFLEDRMSLVSSRISGKAPFRSWVGYKEIESVHAGKTKAEYFVLCINSETSNQRYYEIYKCKDPKKTSSVIRLLNSAMNDPDKIVRGMSSMREVSCVEMDRVRSLSTFDLQRDSEVEDDVHSVVNGEEISVVQHEVQLQEATPLLLENETVEHTQNAPPSDHMEVSIENLKDLGDITYIAFHPTKGPVVNDVGPIYMFSSTSLNHTYETGEVELEQAGYIEHTQPLDFSQSTENSMINTHKTSNSDMGNKMSVKHSSSIEDDLDGDKSRPLKIQAMKSSNVTSESEGSVVDSYTAQPAIYNGYQES